MIFLTRLQQMLLYEAIDDEDLYEEYGSLEIRIGYFNRWSEKQREAIMTAVDNYMSDIEAEFVEGLTDMYYVIKQVMEWEELGKIWGKLL